MKNIGAGLAWGSACVLMGHGPVAVAADAENAGAEDPRLGAVVVTAVRDSMRTALQIKRDTVEISDSVVAEDIHKLPDYSVAGSLQRITGVQITRDRGDGDRVVVRGLSQVETLLNGREIFSVNDAEDYGRSLNFAAVPSDLVSRIDVYKSASADHLDGGVGGTIDLRTHRPFDFAGHKVSVTAQGLHGDLAEQVGPKLSVLLSDRWQSAGWGEFGVLLNVFQQKRYYREDKKDTGAPLARTDIVPVRTVFVNGGTSEYVNLGDREHSGGNLVMQWRPVDNLELYAEASYFDFKTTEDTHQLNVVVDGSTSFVPGSAVLFPGTDDLQSITWTNAALSQLSFIRDTLDRTQQAAVGGSWTGKSASVRADLSYTKSINRLVFFGPFLSGTVAQFSQDMSGSVPSTSVSGTDLSDPATYTGATVGFANRPFAGELFAAQLDAEYFPDDSVIESWSAGVRHARRRGTNAPGQIGDFPAAGLSVPGAAALGLVGAPSYDNYLRGEGGASIDNYLVSNLDGARDIATYREAFGITSSIATQGNPLSLWTIDEVSTALYTKASFVGRTLPIDGNAGLRVVHTRESVDGYRSVPAAGGIAPVRVDSTSVDYLPSLNLRYELDPGLYLRAAASKTMTRPKLSQLSPSTTLFQNIVTPALSSGSGGNPDLEPVRANNLDIAVEKYIDAHSAVHVTAFWKRVRGFVTSVSAAEVHDGVTYQVTRPQNAGTGHIRGIEVGYQQFFDFLPGKWRGLGIQANYTYVDSGSTSIIVGQTVPLQNLSKHSANLVGIYERSRYSMRVAYNWRDDYLSGVTNVVGVGAVPVMTQAYGWLDASFRYRLDDRLTLAIEATNLLKTRRDANYDSRTRPRRSETNDAQVGVALTLAF
ncbi:TonB-dependent receptor [Denitromonas iodatirespirans]|uniref:TonB-dependent receptor n=1 Tax=Denitromonas iodatirespirans TaxID=2795389 RepID=A0A944DAZ0_DENI1|nr:TonB-dependent receptor [Denitromonas iodatirespirans]MBT0961756.1 TonB-dependent receptor [Denitromonas iodatirespirans]